MKLQERRTGEKLRQLIDVFSSVLEYVTMIETREAAENRAYFACDRRVTDT